MRALSRRRNSSCACLESGDRETEFQAGCPFPKRCATLATRGEISKLDKTHALPHNKSNSMMPLGRTLSAAFKTRGINNVVKIEVYPLKTDEVVVTFESVQPGRRQGIWLKTDGGIWVNGQMCPSVELWYDTAPSPVVCRCISSDGKLFLYNIWERQGVSSSLSYSSGMLVEEVPAGRRYRCNDIGFDTQFGKLVFRVERRE